MDTMINFFLTKIWRSEYFHAWILAQARHVATAAGTALVMHGLANKEMSEDMIGFVVAAASFYLANVDVRVVDGKIKVALLTIPPVVDPVAPVVVKDLPEIGTPK